jgi:class 3 adenylate cyclase
MSTVEGGASRIRDALDAGLTIEALDLARRANVESPRNPELVFLAALACVRIGAIRDADRLLRQIEGLQVSDKTLGTDIESLAGRIAKERYADARALGHDSAELHALAALDHYQRAFAISGLAYPAVNAATMAMLQGDRGLAQNLANRALAALTDKITHWDYASAGEALLHLGRLDEAATHYAEARRLAGGRFGDIASIRRQLQLIDTPAALDLLKVVAAPAVIAFSGHMIDHRQRPRPRFPAELELAVAEALRQHIEPLGGAIGYAQAACGADIIFLEILQSLRMQTHIILPFAKRDFLQTSVVFAGEDWERRFETVVEHATSIVLATEEPYLGDDILFEHAANVIHGMALLRASELATESLQLTVRDPGSQPLIGGAEAVARQWSKRGSRVENVDVALLRKFEAVQAPSASDVASTAPPGQTAVTPRELRTLLFADISGFTALPEQYTPDFVQLYLGIVRTIVDSLADPPIYVSTRGDGLYMVFKQPSHAAEFALCLQEALRSVNWPALGLAQETSARIGLHTGPVFATFDPLMEETTYYGTHVNLTARLEPIVQRGQVFVTEAFAASLTSEVGEAYRCRYIGAMSLARKFSEARLYRLQRRAEE